MSRLLATLLCSALFAAPAVGFAQAQAQAAPAPARRGKVTPAELAHQVAQVRGQVKTAEENLRFVETQFTERAEPTNEEAQTRRFSDGEIRYLLGDHKGASVLFYDLVSDAQFQKGGRYADALYYLSDSLYQQQNYIGARLYLRQLLALKSKHYRDALARYLEIAGRLNEFAGIDDYITQARGLSGGELPPELSYVYGKWLFKRSDLPLAERLSRARAVFVPLARGSKVAMQAAYFLGVAYVQEKKLDEAVEQFRLIAQAPADNPRDAKVKELANLSLGRVLYEVGRYDEAIDRYQEIPRESDYFVDSLYEVAWVHVRRGAFEKAKNATDILLLVAPDSTVAPEAKILQGHLLLKLKKYDEAAETYTGVINAYAPVRDEIDALLTVNQDPVAYFDNLLAKNDRDLDVTQLLPPVALKWATTQREVSEAVRIVDDLESGRRGVAEGRDIALRILKALDERGLETFPELQEGYTRADAVETSLTRAEENLVRIEGYLIDDLLSAQQRQELAAARAERAALEQRFRDLPTTQAEVEARRKRLQERVDTASSDAFKLGYELQSMNAVLSAIHKWVADTRAQRKNTPEEERAFAERLGQEEASLVALDQELQEVRKALLDQREIVANTLGGEGEIRRAYDAALAREHALLATVEASASADAAAVLAQAHEVRDSLQGLRTRVVASKSHIQEQVQRRGRQIREKVLAEQRLLEAYDGEVTAASGDARNLVGRIAFDSFRRVRQQFYDLVLKADVGVVDVAFTRKQDKTEEIQKLSQQKDRDLRHLDEEFQEVLRDVD